ncbi:MAG: hypothetical protein JXB35_10935, partial [Anaerolineae bacterium]|nr:hypothetical protein [Anaerolineae bacterium]
MTTGRHPATAIFSAFSTITVGLIRHHPAFMFEYRDVRNSASLVDSNDQGGERFLADASSQVRT